MTGTGAERPKLDELMMAMDVVDTLRHDRIALERDLGQEGRDAALKRRLREIYEGQGLEVTDEILEEGIAALRESRFVYEPPEPSMEVRLARLWVSRWRWGPWAGGAAGLLALWLGWAALSPAPEDRLAQTLSERAGAALAAARTEAAEGEIRAARSAAEAALAAGDLDRAREAVARLSALTDRLLAAYELRIVNRPGERTGVERIPDVNEAARNLYIVVEPVGPDGETLTLPVTNEETGETVRAAKWAVRVPAETYRRIARDKQDDGLLEESVLGAKPAGSLATDWRMPVQGGVITDW